LRKPARAIKGQSTELGLLRQKISDREGLARGIIPVAPLARRGTRENDYVDVLRSTVPVDGYALRRRNSSTSTNPTVQLEQFSTKTRSFLHRGETADDVVDVYASR
jgi:hypothetical protein